MASESCIAGFDEAIASERRDRSTAFTGLPELINGIVCMPLTPRRLEWLRATDSPFVCGGQISRASVVQFLWLVSPAFPFDVIQGGRDEFIEKHADIDVAETLKGIDRYLDAAFLDAPSGKASKPYYSPSAGLYHSLNESYPTGEWTMDKVLDTPLRIIYQLIKAADRASGAIVVNRRSDEVASKWASSLETLRFPESEVEKQIAIYRAKGYLLVSQPSQNKDGSYSFAMQKPHQN